MFDKLNFTKDWTNQRDFPTVETDETQVREDMQILHNEARDALNNLIDSLAALTAAANIGASKNGQVVTVQEILDELLQNATPAMKGYTVENTLTASSNKIPTSAAVAAKIVDIGAGDMQQSVYDPIGKRTDVYGYADSAVATHAAEENPHGITKDTVGLGNVDNTSDADKPISNATRTALEGKVNTSTVIDVAHGGTGKTSAADIRDLLGLGKTTGALPVANGGTGVNSLQTLRKNMGLGDTLGVLPVANGGTGKNNGKDAVKALLASGAMILSANQFGDTLPTTHEAGQIFFLKVT